MNSPLKVMIVGCGDMGGRHADAYADNVYCSVVSLVDPDLKRAEALGARHRNANLFTDLAEALRLCTPHVVSVCVPAFRHAEVCIAALEAGAYVLCEKPIALRLEEADAMIAAHEAHDRRLGIVFQRRYSSLWQKAMEQLPALGTPLHYYAFDQRELRPKRLMHDRNGNGGPVIDCAVHDFDMLLQHFGPVETVYAQGHTFAEGKAELATIDELAIDTAVIQLRFEAGHTAVIHYAWGMPTGSREVTRNEILGPNGTVRLCSDSVQFEQGQGLTDVFPMLSDEDGHDTQIKAFIDAVRSEAPLPVSPSEGRAALRVAYGALESIETGLPVYIGP